MLIEVCLRYTRAREAPADLCVLGVKVAVQLLCTTLLCLLFSILKHN